MRFIILLISIAFIASCTVQKRVHRPGWHVEWKKNYRASHSENDPVITFEKAIDLKSKNTESRNKTVAQSSTNDEFTTNDDIVKLTPRPSQLDNPVIISSPFTEKEEVEIVDLETKNVVSSSDTKTYSAARIAGIVLLFLSLLFFILAIWLLLFALPSAGSVASLAQIAFAGILGIIGFILLSVGFSLLLVRGVVKNEERINTAAENASSTTESQNTELSDWENQGLPPETNSSDKKSKNALVSTIALITVAVLVSIYFLIQK